jgi:predicted  nucleic acid-binding Zn-ribbon protein
LSQIAEIRTLLEIDTALETLRASLEDAEWRTANSPDLDSARQRFSETDAALAESRKNQRRVDGEIAGLTARITPEETRLYDGSVKNPKELTNIQHELDLLKDQRSKLEDQLLEILAGIEVAESENDLAKNALVNAETDRAAETKTLKSEAKRLATAIATADANRAEQLPKVETRNMKSYNDARRRHGSGAVARVAGGNCGGCRVGIPESIRKRAFTADLIAQCPNCDRILYVG